jgi:hypothetical protein
MTWYDDAVRTIIELPADHLEALRAFCRAERVSRAEAIRRAVAAMIARRQAAEARRAFGLWRGRRLDGLRYERRLRREWDR